MKEMVEFKFGNEGQDGQFNFTVVHMKDLYHILIKLDDFWSHKPYYLIIVT